MTTRAPGARWPAEHELRRMPFRMLLAQLRMADGEGDRAHAVLAMGVMASRERDVIEGVVRRRVPHQEAPDVVAGVLHGVSASSFRPTSRAHLRGWIAGVARRRVAQHYRDRRKVERDVPFPRAGGDSWGPGREPGGPGGIDSDALCVRIEDARLRAALRNDHRAALVLHVDFDLDAKTAAAQIPGMSPDNVAQIKSRHRAGLARAVEGELPRVA